MNICELTGKGKQYGQQRQLLPTPHQKSLEAQPTDQDDRRRRQKITMKISTQAIRTLKKKGIIEATGK